MSANQIAMSANHFVIYHGNPAKLRECEASEPCKVVTPHGTFRGVRCPSGKEVVHNSPLFKAEEIVKSGALKPSMHKTSLGQDAISLSSCPTHGYGGNVKFVFKAKDVETRPMCYYEWEHNKEADSGLEKEGHELMNDMPYGANRIRGKYGVNISMYRRECEQIADKEIPLTKLQRLEFWIPWKIREHVYNHACEGHHPSTANVDGREYMLKNLQDQIARAKKLAEKVGAPFELKSCFNSLRSGYNRSIELNKENLEKLKQGILPEDKPKDQVNENCKCS